MVVSDFQTLSTPRDILPGRRFNILPPYTCLVNPFRFTESEWIHLVVSLLQVDNTKLWNSRNSSGDPHGLFLALDAGVGGQ